MNISGEEGWRMTACVAPRDRLIADRLSRAERLRELMFPALPELHWRILKELYFAAARGRAVPVSSVCMEIPLSTALRQVGRMLESGQLRRSADPDDRRKIIISLSPDATRKMIDWANAYVQLTSPSID